MNLSINKKIMEKVELVAIALSPLIIFLLLCFVIFSIKSCQSDNGFRVEHSARMGGGFQQEPTIVDARTFDTLKIAPYGVDTAKKPIPQQKIVYNHYLLSGSDTLFRMLIFTIQNPDDVSKNQKTQLLNWINNNVKIDSTK